MGSILTMENSVRELTQEEMEIKPMAQHINKYIFFLVIFLISCGENNRATQSTVPTPVVIYTPGEIVSDGQGYIEYRVGNTLSLIHI